MNRTPGRLVQVWDTGSGQVREVPLKEAAAGLIRYARTLGPGTPACGELERQALALLHENDHETEIENEKGTAHE